MKLSSGVGLRIAGGCGEDSMMARMLDALFGCWHSHYTFPMTVRAGSGARRSKAASVTGTYVVCLDCGKELPYDWREMKIVDSSTESRQRVGSLATKEAA
jgi:hypothetical protein